MEVEINSIKVELEKDLFTCYYPKYYTEWFVDFRTLMGDRRERIITFGDGIKNQTGIIDSLPVSERINVEEKVVIAKTRNKEDFERECLSTLRDHYIYKRRSFKVPKIEFINTSLVYIPYQIKPKKKRFTNKVVNLLYEPQSKYYDKLKKHLVIRDFYLERG